MPGICPRCSKNVYFAEERIALGKTFHKMCFACANCKKMLDSTNATEHDDELFCRSCYGKKFGPKGYGYGGGAGVLSMDDGTGYINGPPTSNIPATAQAHVAPLLTNGSSPKTFNPAGPKKYGSKIDCPRCGKVVYMAEKMMGGGSCWHKSCFTCFTCNKRLESTSLCEREGEIYCKSCYGKQFGPKGYGFGQGAGVLQMSE